MVSIPQALVGRVAVITGAAHGIGRAYSLRFAREGAHVAVLDIDLPSAEAVAAEITQAGGQGFPVYVDVADPDSVRSAVDQVVSVTGGIDIVLNNAAMFSVVPMGRTGFEDIPRDEWDRMFTINVTGPWLICSAVLPYLKKSGRGRIINVSSTLALKAQRTQAHYVTSKAAILGLTRTMAREVGEFGITANIIAPGNTLSEEQPDEEALAIRNGGVALRSIPRVQMPEDLVGTAVYLASDDAAFVSGQTIVVDGGSHFN